MRITLRDVLNLATLSDTCLELSNLADVLIERALRFARNGWRICMAFRSGATRAEVLKEICSCRA